MASSSNEHQKPFNYVDRTVGVNGLEKIVLREVRGSSAEVYLYGGQVTSWKNDHGEELLFVSSKRKNICAHVRHAVSLCRSFLSSTYYSLRITERTGGKKSDPLPPDHGDPQPPHHGDPQAQFKQPKAIRGGIPICFPQFSNLGSLEAHGFARNRIWNVDPDPGAAPTTNKAYIDLILKPSEDDLKIWPHSFELRLRITLGPGGDLMLTSRVRNTSTDGKPFTFTFAYHTYLSVSDISEVRVEGLETLDYLDNMKNKERFTEQGDAITFEGEVDKIYLSTPTKIAILDHERKRTFVMRKDGLPDAVVWNPWDKKAKAMADFGDEEYRHMLCVEAAVIEKPVTVKPGEEWRGRQELSAVPSSYCSGQLDPRKVLSG